MMLGGGEDELGMLMPVQLSTAEMAAASGGGGPHRVVPKEGERVPQWSQAETRDFIAIRAELERDFTVSKRNKTLWEVVSTRMRERGYRRSPEQCKCKWKNLVNRYKGKETSDPENGRQCPFFKELHAVFQERERNMQQLLLDSESGPSHAKKKLKRLSGDRSSEEFSDDDDEDDEDTDDERLSKSRKKKTDKGQQQQQQQQRATDKSRSSSSIHDILHEFLQQQQRMEAQWQEMIDRRAQERRMFEQEWRQSMEKLERERLMLEQAWREREEQRRIREETRAEKRDALLTTLLNKLIHDGL